METRPADNNSTKEPVKAGQPERQQQKAPADISRPEKALADAPKERDVVVIPLPKGVLMFDSQEIEKSADFPTMLFRYPFLMKYVSEDRMNDPVFQRHLFEHNFNVFAGDFIRKFPYKVAVCKEVAKSYDKIIAELKELQIFNADRFDTPTAREIIRNRKHLNLVEKKRLALVVYPLHDNKDKAYRNNAVENLIKRGYLVVYYEAKEDPDFFKALRMTSAKRPVSLLIVGGHGTPVFMNFGFDETDPSAKITENKVLGVNDFPVSSFLTSFKIMEKESTIILEGCYTACGGFGAFNLATVFRAHFPSSTIFAPAEKAQLGEYTFDENNNIIDVGGTSENGKKEYLRSDPIK